MLLENGSLIIQLKLETSKLQGLANITLGIRKSTHLKVLPVIKKRICLKKHGMCKRSHYNILNYVYCFVIYLLFEYYILLKIYVHKIINIHSK